MSTNGKFVPVPAEYYESFSDEACGTTVTVASGDVREVEQRVTLFPGGVVKTEYRGNATVDVTRASDGAKIDELDISGEGFEIATAPTEDGVVTVTVSLEGSTIVLPMPGKQAAALAEEGLPEFFVYLGGNLTFRDVAQLPDTMEGLPEILESEILNNTAVGVIDLCAALDDAAEPPSTPSPTPVATPSPLPAP